MVPWKMRVEVDSVRRSKIDLEGKGSTTTKNAPDLGDARWTGAFRRC